LHRRTLKCCGGSLHHSTTINIKGESYRLKDKKKAGVVSAKLPGKTEHTTERPAGACGFGLQIGLGKHFESLYRSERSDDLCGFPESVEMLLLSVLSCGTAGRTL
jgi:hypothetical protein